MRVLSMNIPDELDQENRPTAQHLVQETLQAIVAPQPFEYSPEARAEVETLREDAMRGHPWQE